MINWNRISHAIEYYKAKGYHPLEGSWIVSNALNKMVGHSSIQIDDSIRDGLGIATGEAIFLKAHMDGKILRHRYMICLPFFDLEQCGMHIQLFRTDYVGPGALHNMVDEAVLHYRGCSDGEIFRVSTSPGISLIRDNKMIGRYGVRKVGDLSWIYGTGLIETI